MPSATSRGVVGRSYASPAVIGGPAPFNGKNGAALGMVNRKRSVSASAR
jgi:hypothetical protein